MRTAQTRKPCAAGVGLALAAVAVLFAACGGSGGPGVASIGSTSTTTAPSTSGDSSSSQSASVDAQMLKYSQCMRNHGLAKFPDQNSQGDLSIGPGDVPPGGPHSPTFQAAQKACQSLNPGALITPAEKAAANAKALAFAQCMRTNGVPNFPDPNGQGLIKITPATHVAVNSPQYDRAQTDCQKLNNGFETETQG